MQKPHFAKIFFGFFSKTNFRINKVYKFLDLIKVYLIFSFENFLINYKRIKFFG